MTKRTIKVKATRRGFSGVDLPPDTSGLSLSVQVSSAVMAGEREGPFLWIGVKKAQVVRFPGDGTGWHDFDLPKGVHVFSRAHLSRDQVAALVPLLREFVKSGRLDKQRKAAKRRKRT